MVERLEAGKKPAVKMEGQKRFIRFRSLGDGYSVGGGICSFIH